MKVPEENVDCKEDLFNPIIFDYLKEQHQRVLSHLDSMDLKIAQVLALNGLLLSFVFDKLSAAQNPFLFLTGLFCITISLGVGVLIYTGMEVLDSPDKRFYVESNDPRTLKKALIKDIFGSKGGSEIKTSTHEQHKPEIITDYSRKIMKFFYVDSSEGNDQILKFKAQWFNITLRLILLGLIILIIGYYAR